MVNPRLNHPDRLAQSRGLAHDLLQIGSEKRLTANYRRQTARIGFAGRRLGLSIRGDSVTELVAAQSGERNPATLCDEAVNSFDDDCVASLFQHQQPLLQTVLAIPTTGLATRGFDKRRGNSAVTRETFLRELLGDE